MECSHGSKPIKSDQAADPLTARHNAPSVDETGPCTARPSWKRLFTPSLGHATQLGLPPVVTRGVHMREHGRQALFIWSPGASHGIVSTPTWSENAVPGVVDRGGWCQRCSQARWHGWRKLADELDREKTHQLCQSNANEVFLFLFLIISLLTMTTMAATKQGGSNNAGGGPETTPGSWRQRRRGRGGNDAGSGAATPPGGQPQRRLERGGSDARGGEAVAAIAGGRRDDGVAGGDDDGPGRARRCGGGGGEDGGGRRGDEDGEGCRRWWSGRRPAFCTAEQSLALLV